MYIFNTIVLLFTELGRFGNPSNVLLPIFFCLALIAQFMFSARSAQRYSRIPALLLIAVILILELLLHIIHSYTALLLIILLTYSVVLLMGILAGAICAWIMKHVRAKMSGSNR